MHQRTMQLPIRGLTANFDAGRTAARRVSLLDPGACTGLRRRKMVATAERARWRPR